MWCFFRWTWYFYSILSVCLWQSCEQRVQRKRCKSGKNSLLSVVVQLRYDVSQGWLQTTTGTNMVQTGRQQWQTYDRLSDIVIPALGDPRRERPPAVYAHVINVPTRFTVKLPLISGHLPNADSHFLVVSTCYNGQSKQIPRFRWSCQPKLDGEQPNLRLIVRPNFSAVVWWPTSNISRHREWLTTWLWQVSPLLRLCYDITW